MAKLLTRNGKLLTRDGKLLTASSGDACCYRQARDCATDALIDKWAKASDVTTGVAYCDETNPFYFDANDATSLCPGTIVDLSGLTTEATCEECDGGEEYDCRGCGDCCFSTASTVTLNVTLPTAWLNAGSCEAWNEGSDGVLFADGLDNVAVTLHMDLDLPPGGTRQAWYDTYGSEGLVSAAVGYNCVDKRWSFLLTYRIWWPDGETFVEVQIGHDPFCDFDPLPAGDCCGLSASIGITYFDDHNQVRGVGAGSVTITVNDNDCCQDGSGDCQKQVGGCSGDCLDAP